MSEDIIIRAENIGKRYVLNHQTRGASGQYRKFSDTLIHAAKAPLRWAQKLKAERGKQKGATQLSAFNSQLSDKEDFWALKDINFEIKRGDVVGIIGRNGAGKSTLLKILSRITEPTTGRITLRGRVASLLEVGTGFHPELTGRENIYLNGAILGMTKAEIRSKFDEIVAFAEIEKFLDTPVKRYSSGMYVRLAFAVAAHLEPEILIVDEVLAVGDAQFQKKCLGKMQDVARGGERTVLFVSHNMNAVQTLCQSAMLLIKGELAMQGKASEVTQSYVQKGGHTQLQQNWSNLDTAPGNAQVRLLSVKVSHESGDCHRPLMIEEALNLTIDFHSFLREARLNISLVFWTSGQECAFNIISDIKYLKAGHCHASCHIPGYLLNSETYTVDVYIVQDTTQILHLERGALSFEVLEGPRVIEWHGKWMGAVRPKFPFILEQA